MLSRDNVCVVAFRFYSLSHGMVLSFYFAVCLNLLAEAVILLVQTDVQKTATPSHRLFFWCEGRICSKSAKNRGFVAPMRGCTYKMTIFYLCIGFVEVENTRVAYRFGIFGRYSVSISR